MKQDFKSFVIANPAKCIGCRSCEIACAANHRKGEKGNTVGNISTPIIPRLFLTKAEDLFMPIQCRQCEDANCINSCPVKAIAKKGEVIIINEEVCIGCKNCTLVCPLGAVDLLPKYDEGFINQQFERKVEFTAYKCDLCIEGNGEPACVKACPRKALELIAPRESKEQSNIEVGLE